MTEKERFKSDGWKITDRITYPVNFYTIKKCPMCKNAEIEIQERYDIHKRLEEWTLKCKNCGYEITQDKPF